MMSVSSHLTPEPERRLWLILENADALADWLDMRVGALAAFALAEIALVRLAAPGGILGPATMALLWAALPLAVLTVASPRRTPKWLAFLGPARRKPDPSDCLISVDDLAKYTHGELIFRLDKYLGGGITATPYYEDIVGLISERAKSAARKQVFFRASFIVVGVAQPCLLAALLSAR